MRKDRGRKQIILFNFEQSNGTKPPSSRRERTTCDKLKLARTKKHGISYRTYNHSHNRKDK